MYFSKNTGEWKVAWICVVHLWHFSSDCLCRFIFFAYVDFHYFTAL